MKIVVIEWILKILAIVGCATLGILTKKIATPEYHYLVGWIWGSIAIALCNIIHSCFR